MGTVATRVFAFSGATYAGKTCTGLSALPDAAGKYSFNLPAGNYWFGVLKDGVYTLEDQNQTMVVPQITTHSIVSSDTATFSYDALSRLTNATYNDGRTFTYGYDATGNRVQQVAGNAFALPVTSHYTYDPANRLTSDGTKTYTWDANGNLTGDGARTFTFDSANRLRQVIIGANTYTYGYDGDGNRINSAVNGGTALHYQNDNSGLSQVLSESAPQGYGTNLYIPGLAQSSIDGTNAQYFLQDALGSNVMLADASANWTVLPQYDPFGASAPTSLTAFGYTGEQKDASGLEFLRARYYDQNLGIFTSKDPVSGSPYEPITMNGFDYASQNPINDTDPSGRCDGALLDKYMSTNDGRYWDAYWQSCYDDMRNGDPNGPLAIASGGKDQLGLYRVRDDIAATRARHLQELGTIFDNNADFKTRGIAALKYEFDDVMTGVGIISFFLEPCGEGINSATIDEAITSSDAISTVDNINFTITSRLETQSEGDQITSLSDGETETLPSGEKELLDSGPSISNGTIRDFANPQKLIEHFEKHRNEFGFTTPEEYLNSARELVKGGEGINTFLRKNGDKLFYKATTNEFGVLSEQGIIRTYFKPVNGLTYWLAQIGK